MTQPVDHEQPPIEDMIARGTVRRIPLAPHQLTEAITSNKDVFVLAHVGIPKIKPESWWIDIVGLVQKPLRVAFSDLLQMQKREVTSLHECAGFPIAPRIATRRFANVVWGGVALSTLLEQVGVDAKAKYLWSFGVDRGTFEDVESHVYIKDMPLSRISHGEVLLAYELNGEPLDYEHGFPVRLIIPGYYGTNSVKWLYRLELSDRRPSGPFTTRYYNDPIEPTPQNPAGGSKPVWEIAPESIIVSPATGSELRRQEMVIWGWTWSDERVQDVEISTDGGETWALAKLEPRHEWSWQRFTFTWTPAAGGTYSLMSRAIDTRGISQQMKDARNCVYEVSVTIA